MPTTPAQRAWYERNRERLKPVKHAEYLKNRDKYLAMSKARRERDPVAAWEYNTLWRAENADQIKVKQKQYREANVDILRAKGRQYRVEHREERSRYAYKWRKGNREAFKAYHTVWRHKQKRENPFLWAFKIMLINARRKHAGGHCSPEQWLARVIMHGWSCFYCGKPLTGQTLTADHLIPLIKGGSNWPSNLVPACKPCNSSKHSKTLSEFLTWRARVVNCNA
ncbi:hypothetical protein LCGC14_3127360 [marine sediment metagenome]|uniref:HNH nuclease domain-containing protein n=1 Tax=marine sediment metagenome TaxID=412755 RepID=A0A0F8W0R8_9ZZZZ